MRVVEDDPPGTTSDATDETIRRDSVSGPGFSQGTSTFTPSENVGEGEESDRVVEVQARAEGVEDHPSDLVGTIAVAEQRTEISGRILDFLPATADYAPGDEGQSRVPAENTWNVEHTCFVGYGVIDGTVYDDQGTTGTPVNLAAGERTAVEVS